MGCEKDLPKSIGTGELHQDGSITLHLSREMAGTRFHDELHYTPKSPGYAAVKKHIGPVKVDEIFSVKPFCEDEKE